MRSKLLYVLLFLLNTALLAEDKLQSNVRLPAKEKLHLYLLMGQSNMAGRGQIGEEDKTFHVRVYMYTTNNTWELAIEPITKDRKYGLGVGPGLSFGKAMARTEPNVTIGLIPCAVGGTPLSRWSKGGDLYERAKSRAKSAMKDGTLKGILWHQGESDSTKEELANSYEDRLAKIITDIRTDLKQPDLPFVVGELGQFFCHRSDPAKNPFASKVNAALADLPHKVPHTACVKSDGLKDKGDEVHFSGEAQHEMGRRYAVEMQKLLTEEK